jgi:hypothetical protein
MIIIVCQKHQLIMIIRGYQSLKTFNPTNIDVNNIENTKDYLSLVDIYSSDLDYSKTLLFSPWVKKF